MKKRKSVPEISLQPFKKNTGEDAADSEERAYIAPLKWTSKMQQLCRKWQAGEKVSRTTALQCKLAETYNALHIVQKQRDALQQQVDKLKRELEPVHRFGEEFAKRWTPVGLEKEAEKFTLDEELMT